MAATAAPSLPLVVSLHGSDVYVAETLTPGAARGRATSSTRGGGDGVQRGSGEAGDRAWAQILDASRSFRTAWTSIGSGRRAARAMRLAVPLGVAPGAPLVFTAGRLVRKKGFEYLDRRRWRDDLAAAHPSGDRRRRGSPRRARRARPQRRCRRTGAVPRQPEPGRGRGAFRCGRHRGRPLGARRQRERRRPPQRRARSARRGYAAHHDCSGRHRRSRRARSHRRDRAGTRRVGAGGSAGQAGDAIRLVARASAMRRRRLVAERFGWASAATSFEAAYRRALAANPLPAKIYGSFDADARATRSLGSVCSFPRTTTAGRSRASSSRRSRPRAS